MHTFNHADSEILLLFEFILPAITYHGLVSISLFILLNKIQFNIKIYNSFYIIYRYFHAPATD